MQFEFQIGASRDRHRNGKRRVTTRRNRDIVLSGHHWQQKAALRIGGRRRGSHSHVSLRNGLAVCGDHMAVKTSVTGPSSALPTAASGSAGSPGKQGKQEKQQCRNEHGLTQFCKRSWMLARRCCGDRQWGSAECTLACGDRHFTQALRAFFRCRINRSFTAPEARQYLVDRQNDEEVDGCRY